MSTHRGLRVAQVPCAPPSPAEIVPFQLDDWWLDGDEFATGWILEYASIWTLYHRRGPRIALWAMPGLGMTPAGRGTVGSSTYPGDHAGATGLARPVGGWRHEGLPVYGVFQLAQPARWIAGQIAADIAWQDPHGYGIIRANWGGYLPTTGDYDDSELPAPADVVLVNPYEAADPDHTRSGLLAEHGKTFLAAYAGTGWGDGRRDELFRYTILSIADPTSYVQPAQFCAAYRPSLIGLPWPSGGPSLLHYTPDVAW